ncbi:MAG: methyltransferase domain-containing protein [Oligoflexia bacterium]|nr:methyltransferase domain-containing protein [Oligoflexia bacterium]
MSIGVLLAVIPVRWNGSRADDSRPKGSNAYQIVTGDDSEDDRRRWDTLYSTRTYVFGKEPAAFLRDNIGQLSVGKALDLAMGEGRNAVYLAKKGFSVDGVDISEVALQKARRLASENKVSITAINADLSAYTIRPETYQLIVNIDYLQRSLIPQIRRGLKRGGIVVFETYTVEHLKNANGQHMRRDYLLERGELRRFFRDYEILVYRETNDGKEARASLIARKP